MGKKSRKKRSWEEDEELEEERKEMEVGRGENRGEEEPSLCHYINKN
jgi:hypothetical protein